MGLESIISSIISLVLGGGLTAFFTIRSQKAKGEAEAKKAEAEAKTTELDNVQEAIKIYREMADSLRVELKSANDDRAALRDELAESRREREEMTAELTKLRKQISRLASINKKICGLLEGINPENIEQIVEQIKKINNEIN